MYYTHEKKRKKEKKRKSKKYYKIKSTGDELNVRYDKVNFPVGVKAVTNFPHFFKMSSEFIPLPRNMEFDIINTSYIGNKASQRR